MVRQILCHMSPSYFRRREQQKQERGDALAMRRPKLSTSKAASLYALYSAHSPPIPRPSGGKDTNTCSGQETDPLDGEESDPSSDRPESIWTARDPGRLPGGSPGSQCWDGPGSAEGSGGGGTFPSAWDLRRMVMGDFMCVKDFEPRDSCLALLAPKILESRRTAKLEKEGSPSKTGPSGGPGMVPRSTKAQFAAKKTEAPKTAKKKVKRQARPVSEQPDPSNPATKFAHPAAKGIASKGGVGQSTPSVHTDKENARALPNPISQTVQPVPDRGQGASTALAAHPLEASSDSKPKGQAAVAGQKERVRVKSGPSAGIDGFGGAEERMRLGRPSESPMTIILKACYERDSKGPPHGKGGTASFWIPDFWFGRAVPEPPRPVNALLGCGSKWADRAAKCSQMIRVGGGGSIMKYFENLIARY
jgi:hypothetical protein